MGDALGAGWEMSSRKDVLSQWDLVLSGFRKREGKYGLYHQPGMYTDDYEMTMGVVNALKETSGMTQECLVRHWIQVAKDPTRDGYGSFRHVLEHRNEDWRPYLEEQRIKQQQSPHPGNGPLMRQIPFLFAPDPYKCVLTNANATHPNPLAIVSGLCLMRASQYILMENGKPPNVLQDLIGFCPTLTTVEKGVVEHVVQRLRLLDVSKAPGNERCDQLSDTDIETMFGPTTCPYYQGVGIPPFAQQTMYAAVYLLKWMDNGVDAFGSLLRCISLGGDVDTLGSIVASIVLPRKGTKSLPKWIEKNIEKKRGKQKEVRRRSKRILHGYNKSQMHFKRQKNKK